MAAKFRRNPFHLSLDWFRHIDARSIRNMAVGACNVLACGIAGSESNLELSSLATGRPSVSRDLRDLIRRMSLANPLWGAPRVDGELLKLGIEVSQVTVAKYTARHHRPPSRTWWTFFKNHAQQKAMRYWRRSTLLPDGSLQGRRNRVGLATALMKLAKESALLEDLELLPVLCCAVLAGPYRSHSET
jgi:hypothetical protein